MSDAQNLTYGNLFNLCTVSGGVASPADLDAETEKAAMVFCMPYTMTISHAGCWYGARSGTPPTYRISIQGVDSSGNPDGTVKGGGSPASTTFTPPADTTWNNQWKWFALDNSYSATRGEMLAVVLDWSSGTISNANQSTMGGTGTYMGDDVLILPNHQFYTGSAWTKYAGSPLYAVKNAASPTKVVGRFFESLDNQTYSRAVLKFNVPTTFCASYKIRGAKVRIYTVAATTWTLGLWDASSTLQSVTVDSDQVKGGSTANAVIYFDESTLSTLTAGTSYYIGVEQTGGAVALSCQVFDADVNQQMAGPFSSNWTFSSWNGSSWSDDNTKVPIIQLILEDVTAPTGSGSGLMIHPGMGGGMRG